MSNHIELVEVFLATMRIGAIWVGVNKRLAPAEVAFMLDDADVSLVVADAESAPAAASAGHRVKIAEPENNTCEWSELMSAAVPHDALPDVDPHAPAAIAYTSGTTGRPKGVVHSQHNLLLPGAVRVRQPAPADEPRPGVCLPLTILNLMILGPLTSFQRAEPCILMDRVDPVGLAEWIRAENVTSFAAVPTIIHDLLTHPDVTNGDLRSLVRPGVGGAACPPALRDLYERRFGTRITTGYGLTEAPTAVTDEDPSLPAVPGSAGRPLPHVRIEIRDDHGAILPPGASGEICVAAATEGRFAGVYTPMLGYWRRPEATASAFYDDGTVLRTGDIGHLGTDGDLFVTERKNDLILRGGANVYPAEVERVLHEFQGVAASAVIGCPDDRLGERVVAVIVPERGTTISADDLRDHCARELAKYKVPERFVFVDELPRNAMGKVIKLRLRQELSDAGLLT